MNTLKKYSLVALATLSLSLLVACGDSSTGSASDNNITSTNTATFEIDGKSKVYDKYNSFNQGILALGQSEDDLISLFFPMPGDSTVFPIIYSDDSKDLITVSIVIGEETYSATNGIMGFGAMGSYTITIESYESEKISGSFEFIAINIRDNKDSVVVNNGKFYEIPSL